MRADKKSKAFELEPGEHINRDDCIKYIFGAGYVKEII